MDLKSNRNLADMFPHTHLSHSIAHEKEVFFF